MPGISFDRAAEFYDTTRSLAPEVSARITDAVLRELSQVGAERLLEVGAGTGRIAYPLATRGVGVTALDISLPMLRKFREKLRPGDGAADFLLADARRLPFRSASFPAVLSVHLLHLISEWQQAIREMRRVLATGGIVLRQGEEDDFESHPEHRESDAAWIAILARRGYVPRKRAGVEETNAFVRQIGGSLRTVQVASDFHVRSERRWLDDLRRRIHSNTWEVPDDIYWPAVDEYEAWARERSADLDRERKVTVWYHLDVWSWA